VLRGSALSRRIAVGLLILSAVLAEAADGEDATPADAEEPPPHLWPTIGMLMTGMMLPGVVCRAIQLRNRSAEDETDTEALKAEAAHCEDAGPHDQAPQKCGLSLEQRCAMAAAEDEEKMQQLTQLEQEVLKEEGQVVNMLHTTWNSLDESSALLDAGEGTQEGSMKQVAVEDILVKVPKERFDVPSMKDRGEPLEVTLKKYAEVVYVDPPIAPGFQPGPSLVAPSLLASNFQYPAPASIEMRDVDMSGLYCGSTCGTGSCWLAAALCGAGSMVPSASRAPLPGGSPREAATGSPPPPQPHAGR